MADESDLEKTESASPRRREKAREEGDVPRSRELDTVFALLASIAGLWIFGAGIATDLLALLDRGLSIAGGPHDDPTFLLRELKDPLLGLMAGLVPMFLLVTLASMASPAVLGGFLVSGKALTPKFSRLDPLAGIGRMFSSKSLIELVKALLKTAVVGLSGYYAVDALTLEALDLPKAEIQTAIAHHAELLLLGVTTVGATLILIALFDAPVQIFQYEQKLKMTKQQVKDEYKETEGNPEIKAKIRAQQRAMSRGRMMSKVPTADVIVTNPTHFAVALVYGEDSGAPRVVAKGTDATAAKIRELAAEHKVPTLESPALARALYRHVELDQEIPAALYTAVAQVLAYVFALRRPDAARLKLVPPNDVAVPEGFDMIPDPQQPGAWLPTPRRSA